MPVYLTAVLAVACYAALSPLAKKFAFDVPPFTFIFITMVFLASFALIASRLTEASYPLSSIKPVTFGYMAMFALINLASFTLYLLATRNMPIVEYQMFELLGPIFGGIIAWYLLREPLSYNHAIGLGFIVVGLVIATRK